MDRPRVIVLTLFVLLVGLLGPHLESGSLAQVPPPASVGRPAPAPLPDPAAVEPAAYVPSGLLPDEVSPTGPLTNVNIRFPQQQPGVAGAPAAPPETAGAATPPPEIVALAAGLGNDPRLIYEYVHNQIDTIPTWGLMRSSRQTVADKAGNPFEQAQLLGELLQAAGFDVRYVVGTVRIPTPQAVNWVGLTNDTVLVNVFWNGGIPAALATDEPNVLRIDHIWVKVNVAGTWYALDPSFKAYTVTPGLDLAGAMGYNRTSFLNAATAGATVVEPYIRQVNEANIDASLATYATHLVDYLRANLPQAGLSAAIGWRSITPQTAAGLPSTLPYAVEGTYGDYTSIPQGYVCRLRVQLPGIDYVADMPQVGAQRVTVFYRGATVADQQAITTAGGIFNLNPAYAVNMVPELRVGGALVGTGSAVALGNWEPITVTLLTPVSIGGGQTWQPSYIPQWIQAGAWYALPLAVERVTPEALRLQSQELEDALASGAAATSEAVLGQTLHTLGMAYFAQVGASNELAARLAAVVRIPFFLGMIMSQNLAVTEWDWHSNAWWAKRVGAGASQIDVRLNYCGALAMDGNSDRERAYWTDAGHKSSSIEQATIEQLENTQAISSIRVLDLANDSGLKIYHVLTTTVDAIMPLLNYNDNIKSSLRRDVQAGYEVVVPEGNITFQQWTGMAWLTLDRRSGSSGYWISGGLGAVPEGAVQLRQNGGAGVQPGMVSSPQVQSNLGNGAVGGTGCTHCNQPAGGPNNVGSDPVDAVTGAFLTSVPGLSLGMVGLPIEFVRSYVSDAHRQDGPLGFGWSHSYQRNVVTTTNWARAFGYRSPLDAAAAIAETFVGTDIARVAPGGLTLVRMVAGTTGVNWLLEQVLTNTVSVSAGGQTRQYVRLPDGSYSPPPGDYAVLTRNGDGSYTVVEKDGARADYSSGRATRLTDANGNQTALTYDGAGKLSRVQNAVGQRIDLTYTGQQLTQVADSGGRTLRFAYDAAGNLKTAVDVRGGATTYAYDAAHRVLSVTDPLSVTHTTNVYDSQGRVAQQTDGRAGVTLYRYGDARTLVVDPLGNATAYGIDRNGRIAGRSDALGAIDSVTYDARDNVLARADGLGHTTTYGYDARGNLVRRTLPTGESATFVYDAQNNLTSETDELGHATAYQYDAHRNPVRIVDALGGVITATYNAQGLPTAWTDANGHTSTFGYDASGNLTRSTDALSHTTTVASDAWGRPLTVTTPSGARSTFSYDAAGNLLQGTDPLGYATRWTYDANGLLLTRTDALGHVTRYAYDALLSLSAVTDALGNVTRYASDGNGRLVGATDARGNTTSYGRDARGQVVTVTDPLSRIRRYARDVEGEITAVTKADGHSIGYGYDARGFLTRVQSSDGMSVTLSSNPTGMVTATAGAGGPVAITYDALGRVSRADYADGLATTYTYDAVGNVLHIRSQKAGATLYDAQNTYDAADRLLTARDVVAGQTITNTYTLDGDLSGADCSSGAQVRITRDAAGRITQVVNRGAGGAVLSSFAYTYDAVGNPTQIVRGGPGAPLAVSYTYDAVDRLTRESYPRYNVDYAYDAVGNRVSKTGPQGATAYAYDAADQLLSAGPVTFTYDANGNRTGRVDDRGAWLLAYGDLDRLGSITSPGGAVTGFSYDWLGNTSSRTTASGTARYTYSGSALILEQQGAEGAAYLYGVNGLAFGRELAAGGLGWSYQGDALGSVADVADASGQLRAAASFDAYGLQRLAAGGSDDPFRFLGQLGVRAEPALNDLYLMGRRYYDAATGTFLSRDPLPGTLGEPASAQSYIYALDNPLRSVDPSGLRPNRGDYYIRSFSELTAGEKLIYIAQYGQYVAGLSGPPTDRAAPGGPGDVGPRAGARNTPA